MKLPVTIGHTESGRDLARSRTSRAARDLIILILIGLLTLTASLWLDPFARLVPWIYSHDNWKLDELFTLDIVLVLGLAIYSWRRWQEMRAEIRERERAQERARLLSVTLESTIDEVRTLRSILPLCESCQRIQDGDRSWVSLELFVEANSRTRFAHGLCPECARQIYRPGERGGHDGS